MTGWLTPLAFLWFVVAVFLQRTELINQRQELTMMRDEYRQSREAAERQASHLEASSLVQARQVFITMLDDSMATNVFNARQIHFRLFRLGRDNAKTINSENPREIFIATNSILNRLDDDVIVQLNNEQRESWRKFIQLLEEMIARHKAMKERAREAKLLDYYIDIHRHSEGGELVRRAEDLVRISRELDHGAP